MDVVAMGSARWIGRRIDERFVVEGVLGEGGCGVVFDVVDEVSGQRRALKIMRRPAAKARTLAVRFVREAAAAMSLASEHVVRVLDAGTDRGRPYLVMERLFGLSLHQHLKNGGRVSVREAADIGLQTCEGLAHAHAHGIVHRDVKPSNVFLAHAPDGPPVVKVLDFGISKMARVLAGTDSVNLTSSGMFLGSPRFMPPEQIRCAKSVDARADIWALGAVLYTALAGHPPFGAFVGRTASLRAITTAILEDPYLAFAKLGLSVPRGFEAVIARSLSRSVDFRFADVAQVAAGLAPFASPERARRLPAIGIVLAQGAYETAARAAGMLR